MKALVNLTALSLVAFAMNSQAKEIDLAHGLKNTSVEVSEDSQVDVLIPAGDHVSVKLLRDSVDAGCSYDGISNGGMAWTVSLSAGIGTQAESCTFRITEDGQSATVTLYYSASDD